MSCNGPGLDVGYRWKALPTHACFFCGAHGATGYAAEVVIHTENERRSFQGAGYGHDPLGAVLLAIADAWGLRERWRPGP